MKEEPKYCTDRPVNDHLYAVIRSCLKHCSASTDSSCACQWAALEFISEYAALFIRGECLVPFLFVHWSIDVRCQTGHARCKYFFRSSKYFPEINVFYQRNTLFVSKLKPKGEISVLFICWMSYYSTCAFMWLAFYKFQLNVQQWKVDQSIVVLFQSL